MSSFFIWIADLPDEIRVRTRSRADPIDRGVERVRPNVLANTAEVGRLLHEHNAVCALEGPSCVHCLAEVEPGFIYDDLTYDRMPAAQKERRKAKKNENYARMTAAQKERVKAKYAAQNARKRLHYARMPAAQKESKLAKKRLHYARMPASQKESKQAKMRLYYARMRAVQKETYKAQKKN